MSTTYDGVDSFPTSITIPSDGDTKPASSVNAALEGLADRTTLLNERHKESSQLIYLAGNSPSDPGSFETFEWDTIADAWTKSVNIQKDVTGCLVGDRLVCHFLTTGIFEAHGSSVPLAYTRLYAIDDNAGTPAESQVVGAQGILGHAGSVLDTYFPVPLLGRHVVTKAGTTRVGLEVRLALTGVSGFLLRIHHGVSLILERVRGN